MKIGLLLLLWMTWTAQGLAQVEQPVLVSSPPDRRRPPFLSRFRYRPEHVADVRVMVARSVSWLLAR